MKYTLLKMNNLRLPVEYKRFLMNACNACGWSPEEIVCAALKSWVRNEGREFTQMVMENVRNEEYSASVIKEILKKEKEKPP